MDKKSFKIVVKLGTEIISAKANYIVEGVPDDALERLESGSTWLVLTPEAHEDLVKLPEQRLKKIISIRSQQGFDSDVKILEKALKEIQQPKPKEVKANNQEVKSEN